MQLTDDNKPYKPIGSNKELFYCKAKEVLCVGPAGSGKSVAALNKIHLLMMKYEKSRGLLLRKTRASMTQSTLVSFEQKVVQANYLDIEDGVSRSHRISYKYPNGSELALGGMDFPSRLLSTEFDVILIDEAVEILEEEYEILLSRLRNNRIPYQQMICCCNPSFPTHWLNRRANEGKMVRLKSTHKDNPSITQDYLDMLNRLTGTRKERLLYGNWCGAEGLIYETFLENVITDQQLPSPAIKSYGGIDYGHRDPTAITVGVECQDSIIYIVEEFCKSEYPLEQLATKCMQLKNKWNIECFYCDSSRPEITGLLHRAGIPIRIKKISSIETGIAMVDLRLRNGYLKIYKSCQNIIEEAQSYVRKPVKDGFDEKPKEGKEHSLDSLRYMISAVDLGRRLQFNGNNKPIIEKENIDVIDKRLQTFIEPNIKLIQDRNKQIKEQQERLNQLAWAGSDG